MGTDEMDTTQAVVYIDGQPVQYGGEITLPEITPGQEEPQEIAPVVIPDTGISTEMACKAAAAFSSAWRAITTTVDTLADTIIDWLQTVEAAVRAAEEFRKALRWAEAYNRPLAYRYHHTKKKRTRKKYAKRILMWYREEILG